MHRSRQIYRQKTHRDEVEEERQLLHHPIL
jgi:hypothetical protein